MQNVDQIVDARTGLSKMGGPPDFWLHCNKKMLGQVDFVFFFRCAIFSYDVINFRDMMSSTIFFNGNIVFDSTN